MIRRAIALLLLLALLLPVTGCWSRTEVNQLAIVSMMAFDKRQDGRLQVWLQVVVPAHAGGAAAVPGGGDGQNPFITVSGSGETVLEAARHIQTRLSRRIFWAHSRIILIGERLARDGMRPVTDFMLRHRELRLDNYVLMVKGDVGEVMGSRLDLEKQPVDALREVLRAKTGTVATVGDWVRQRASSGADPYMGIVTLEMPPKGAPKGERPQLQLTGTALFRGDRCIGILDTHLTRGLLWLQGQVYSGVVTLRMPGAPEGQISLEYVASHINRRVRMQNGKPVIQYKIYTDGTINDEQVNLDLSDPRIIEKVAQEMEGEVKRRIEAAMRQIRALQVDPAGLGELIHQQRPSDWRSLAKGWHTTGLLETPVQVIVEAGVRRTGLSGAPRGEPEEELIQEVK